MLLRDGAPIIRRDSEMGKIRLKADLKLPVEMLNLFLTHVLPYWVVMPGYKQNCKFYYCYKEKAGQWRLWLGEKKKKTRKRTTMQCESRKDFVSSLKLHVT